MKNLLFVAMLCNLFTIAPLATKAQPKFNFVAGIKSLSDNDASYVGTSYTPENTTKKVIAVAKRIAAPVLIATELCTSLQFKFAQLLNKDVETITNIPLFNFIDEWWATRYRYGGTTKYGVDCSSYTGHLFQEVFGFTLPRTAREQYAMSIRVHRDELQEGDLVFFNTRGGVSHVGLYLSDGYFTHSSSSAGVTISNLNETYYSRKFIGGGRVMETVTEYQYPE
jgi:cell wall-associated NlpC family hydrolase